MSVRHLAVRVVAWLLLLVFTLSLAISPVTAVADVVDMSQCSVSNVLAGRRHSRAVEARIAAILGYQDWNQMVLAIRSIMAA